MASLLSMLGLNSSSGMPSSMTDEELQALQQNQTPFSTLFGLNPSAYQDTSSSAAQGNDASTTTDTETPIAPATGDPDVTVSDDDKSAQDASDSAQAAPQSSSDAGVSSAVNNIVNSGSDDTSAAQNADQPGFLKKLFKATENPNVSMALMQAGLGMMANSRYGTPWWSAIGQGAQEGLGTYEALKQQQIQNQMAMYTAQNKVRMDNADINAKNATTQGTLLGNQQLQARQQLLAQIASGQLSPNSPQVAFMGASAGMKPEDITAMQQSYAPKLGTPKEFTGNDGKQYVQDQTPTGQPVGQPYLKAATPITVSPGANVVQTQAMNADGTSPTVASGGLTPEQTKQVQAYSDNASQYKQKADQLQTYIQAMQDPAYQQAQSSGVAGNLQAYLRSKGLSSNPVQVINQAIANEQTAGNLATIEKSGVSRLDQKTQESVIKNGIDLNTASPATKLALAQDIYDSYRNQQNQNYRSAQWDGSGLPNITKNTVQLPDGSVIKAGTNRSDYIGGNAVTNNPMQPTKNAPSMNPQMQQLINLARSGNRTAQQALNAHNVKWS